MSDVSRTKWMRGICLISLFILTGCSTLSTSPTVTPAEEVFAEPPPTPPSTLPELIQVLSSDIATARIGAARVLATMGTEATVAVPALTKNLYHRNTDVRRASAQALGSIGSGAKPAVPILIAVLLGDQVVHARRDSARALGQIGDTSAIPALVHALEDEYSGVRTKAAESIAILTGQEFPDVGETGYSLDENGVALITIAARDWWQQEGQHQDWLQP